MSNPQSLSSNALGSGRQPDASSSFPAYYLDFSEPGPEQHLFYFVDDLTEEEVQILLSAIHRDYEERYGAFNLSVRRRAVTAMSLSERLVSERRWEELRRDIEVDEAIGWLTNPSSKRLRSVELYWWAEHYRRRLIELRGDGSPGGADAHPAPSNNPAPQMPSTTEDDVETEATEAVETEADEPAYSGRWYLAHSDGQLDADRLRKAAHAERITARKGNGNRNHYTLDSVCKAWPEFAARLKAAHKQE